MKSYKINLMIMFFTANALFLQADVQLTADTPDHIPEGMSDSEAAGVLKDILQRSPASHTPYKVLTGIYLKKDDLKGIEQYFDNLTNRDDPYLSWARANISVMREKYEEAYGLYKEVIEEVPDFSRVYYDIVYCAFSFMAFHGSMKMLSELDALFTEKAAKNTTPPVVMGLGHVFNNMRKKKKALAQFIKAKEMDESNLYARYELGKIYIEIKQYPLALEIFENLLKLSDIYKSNEFEGDVYKAMGELLVKTGKPREGIEFLDRALPVYRRFRNLAGEKEALVIKGDALRILPDNNGAISLYREALELATLENDTFNRLRISQYLGDLYNNESYYADALTYYEDALSLIRKTVFRDYEAILLNTLSFIYLQFNNYETSLDYSLQSLELLKRNEKAFIDKIAILTLNAGHIYYRMKDFGSAENSYNKALEMFEKLGKYEEMGITYIHKGTLNEKIDEDDESIKCYIKAEEIFSKTGTTNKDLLLAYRKAILHKKHGEHLQAEKLFKKVLKDTGSNTDRSLIYRTKAELAGIYHQQKDYEASFKNYIESIRLAESSRMNLKIDDLKTGFYKLRIKIFERFVSLLHEMHLDAPEKGFDRLSFKYAEKSRAQSFLDSLEETKIELNGSVTADKALREEERKLEEKYAFLMTELQKERLKKEGSPDRNKIKSLGQKISAIEESFMKLKFRMITSGTGYATQKYKEPVTIEHLQKRILDDSTILLEYMATSSALMAWKITKNKLDFYRFPVSSADLTNKIKTLRVLAGQPLRADIFSEKAHALYSEILEPMLMGVPGGSTLLISPGGVLSYLPFEMLVTKYEKGTGYKETTFLIHDFTAHYIQSAGIMDLLNTKSPPGKKKYRNELLAIGDPDFSITGSQKGIDELRSVVSGDWDRDRGAVTRLVHSNREVKRIGSIYKNSDIFLRYYAREEVIKEPLQRLDSYRYIHLATHGILNQSRPYNSGLLFTQDEDPKEDGFLQMREILNLKIDAEMVVLSACSTGLGQLIKGEGIIGLTRAWLYAGASSVVVSLWNVNDQSTSVLMEKFYLNINEGMNKAEALRKAKLDLIVGYSEQGYNNPFHWAGFILTGKK